MHSHSRCIVVDPLDLGDMNEKMSMAYAKPSEYDSVSTTEIA